jgi:methionyl-tRNA formyltransferase
MRITVFTGNQPRHIALVNKLANESDGVYAVLECTTVFPGQVEDFYKRSEVMQRYFQKVIEAERELYGDVLFSMNNVRTLSLKIGDLNKLEYGQLQEALSSDVFIVFGASFIQGWLIDFLVSHRAINIHMGLSPYFRGSSCNFWALYDHKSEYVGSTIHMLSKGLDSGAILYHALPTFGGEDPFLFAMKAVEAAQRSLVEKMATGELLHLEPHAQDRSLELRYTRNADFNDRVAEEYLARNLRPSDIATLFARATRPDLIRSFYY